MMAKIRTSGLVPENIVSRAYRFRFRVRGSGAIAVRRSALQLNALTCKYASRTVRIGSARNCSLGTEIPALAVWKPWAAVPKVIRSGVTLVLVSKEVRDFHA